MSEEQKDYTLEQLRDIVMALQKQVKTLKVKQSQLVDVTNQNANEFKKVLSQVNSGFKHVDSILKKLNNTQKIIIRETNPVVGEYKKAQFEHMKMVFSASDRGPKMDN